VRQKLNSVLISSNAVDELGAQLFRIKGMSRYLDAVKKNIKKQEYDANRYKGSVKIPLKFHSEFTSSEAEAEAESNKEREKRAVVHEPDGSTLAINLPIEAFNKSVQPKQNLMLEVLQATTNKLPQPEDDEATVVGVQADERTKSKYPPKEPNNSELRKVTELWNQYKPHECPKTTTITGARLRLVQKFLKRWKDPWLVGSLAYSLRANQGFYKGKTGWIANIEYILREANQAALIEAAPARISQIPDSLRENEHWDLLACAKECIELDGGV